MEGENGDGACIALPARGGARPIWHHQFATGVFANDVAGGPSTPARLKCSYKKKARTFSTSLAAGLSRIRLERWALVRARGGASLPMASVPFAGVATFGSSRRVAGSRRGVSPTPRVAGVTRVAGGHESHGPPRNRNGCASRHPCRLDRRVVTRLHAVREPSSGGEIGVDVVSTPFIAGDDRSGVGNDNTTASADAARRVRAAKKGASSYRVSGGDGGVSSGDDGEGEGEVLGETRGAGDDACKKQIEPAKKKTGGGRRGKSYAVSRRGTGGTQPLNEGPNGTQQQNLHKKVTMSAALKRTRYNRPIASKESSENSSEDVVRGNDDRPRWLSNQHTAGPGQQAQQKRSNLTGGSRGNNGGAPMRPGERIVAALQKVQVSDGVERLSWEHDDTTGVGQRLTRDTTEVSYGTIHSAVTKPLGGKAKFSAPTLNFAIKELGERGDFNRAHALFLWMRAQGKGVKKDPGYRDRTQDRTGDEPGNKYAPNRHTLASLFGCASDKAHAKTVTRVWKVRDFPVYPIPPDGSARLPFLPCLPRPGTRSGALW